MRVQADPNGTVGWLSCGMPGDIGGTKLRDGVVSRLRCGHTLLWREQDRCQLMQLPDFHSHV